ncbi:hypothetical protein GCM10022222_34500 [Amycolatopsis ultiminotia]|uniref:DUF3558 domain-containing protein n=1 Tax=Amycolatopsis ultiminotia TaxID=543629 RepID=A0ABP6WA82_9PSEU
MRRKRLGLVALSAVLLGCAAVLAAERPWAGPADPEAATLPASCPALAGQPPARYGVPAAFTAPAGPGSTIRGGLCEWGEPDHGSAPLQAKYRLYPRAGRQSGTEEAEHGAAALVTRNQGPGRGGTLGADTPLPGLGDEARISAHDILVVLVTRKANVVLTLQYRVPDDEPRQLSETRAESCARTLLDQIRTA